MGINIVLLEKLPHESFAQLVYDKFLTINMTDYKREFDVLFCEVYKTGDGEQDKPILESEAVNGMLSKYQGELLRVQYSCDKPKRANDAKIAFITISHMSNRNQFNATILAAAETWLPADPTYYVGLTKHSRSAVAS